MRQNWRLKQVDVTVTKIDGARYRVDAFLIFDMPGDAHPDRYVGPVKILFAGEAKAQDLKIERFTINGREPDRRLIAVQDPGTFVMGSIEKPLRTQPWALHLATSLNADRGRLALPTSDAGGGPIAVTIQTPGGETIKADRLVSSILVASTADGPATGWLLSGGLAVAAVIAVVTVFLVRRRRRA